MTTKNYTGADLSGASGDKNRVLTLDNTIETVDDRFFVTYSGSYLYIDTDYTIDHKSANTTVTFLINVSDGSWLALSWRQYLYWFSDFEERFDNDEISVKKFLRKAENVWRVLDDNDIIFEDSSNEGRWIRMWRRALAEYWSR